MKPKASGNVPAKVAQLPASKQFDLFSHFFGDPSDLSNTIELWDAIPKYAVTPRKQNTLRAEGKRLPVHSYEFDYRKRRCRLEIQPATLKIEDGTFQDFYPSADEELVEEVLRKIFADQQFGRHDVEGTESWVKFSLQMIRKELQNRGKTRSIDQIKRSIYILANSMVRFYVEDDSDPTYTNPILTDVTRVTREKYLSDPSAMWWAKLPALLSKSINELSYRQFNYAKLIQMQSQFARWLHKRLSHNYTNASFVNTYSVLFSTLQRDSGLLTYVRTQENVKTLEAALEELVSFSVLFSWEKEERRGDKNKILDIKYTFTPHSDFVAEVKAANARSRDHQEAIDRGGR